MLAKSLFFLLFGLSLVCLFMGLRRKEGVVQFPVLFSAAFAFSIVPQLVNHVFFPGRLPEIVYRDHGVEWGIVMCILCLVAGVVGYRSKAKDPKLLRRWIPDVDGGRIFWIGVVLCMIGAVGAWRVTELAGGLRARYVEGGHYGMEWSGAPVLWTYVAKLLPLGMILCLNSAMMRGSLLRWGTTALVMAYPLASVIFLGRRSAAFALALIVITSLWFRRRWAPPRWVSIVGMVFAGLLIVLLPYYRGYANRTGDIRAAIAEIDAGAAIGAYFQGEKGEGMDNLIMGIPARQAIVSYNLGTGFWNGLVDYLVPGQIVGYTVKKRMMLNVGLADDDAFLKYCGMIFEYGSFSTGPYSAFHEFWFVGCMLFYLAAIFYRRMWILASGRGHLGAQILYVASLLIVPMAVVNSLTETFPMFTLSIAVLWPSLWFARKRVPGEVPRWRSRHGKRARRLSPGGAPSPASSAVAGDPVHR